MTAVPIPRTWRPTVWGASRAIDSAVIGGATSSWPASAWGLGGFVAVWAHAGRNGVRADGGEAHTALRRESARR